MENQVKVAIQVDEKWPVFTLEILTPENKDRVPKDNIESIPSILLEDFNRVQREYEHIQSKLHKIFYKQ